ncbi:hypothetical protein Tco_0498293, partial [Tanacetum coccineum]
GEAAAASKKKGHLSWKSQDQSKWYAPERRSDFRGQSSEDPLTRTPKEILAAEAGKFKPPPPMVTPAEKEAATSFAISTTIKGITRTSACS